MNAIVFFILGWASFASADSSIGGYSYETPSYETPWLDQNSGWHPPQQVDRSSQLANLLRTNARQAVTDPSVLVGVVGVSALSFTYTPHDRAIVFAFTRLFHDEGWNECSLHSHRNCCSSKYGNLSQQKD